MNKKIITLLIFCILLSAAVIANQNFMSKDRNNAYIINAEIRKGWNIIAGTMPTEGILSTSEIKATDIAAMWYYSPLSKEYIRVHPEPELEKLQAADDDVVLTSAMWVYSKKSGMISYSTLEDYPPLSQRQLTPGWNFVTVTIDMYKGTYHPNEGYTNEYFSWDAIKGDCDYQRIVFFNPATQDWVEISPDLEIKSYDFDDFMGAGMLVKVSNACNLKEPTADVMQPPAIPN